MTKCKYIYSVWALKDGVWYWYSFCGLKYAREKVRLMRTEGYTNFYERISVWRSPVGKGFFHKVRYSSTSLKRLAKEIN